MGLLDQLWDETVAGPPPDSGLGKLRKYSSFSQSSSAPATPPAVTRSITIARPPALSVDSPRGGEPSGSSVPSSPASAPDSPFATATTPKGESWRKLRRKPKAADGPEVPAVGPRSPTVYDWVVISSLDR
ncbi:hypothetical protein ACP70R_017566 [Stipagrostis hirtigluma subsp. patula]